MALQLPGTTRVRPKPATSQPVACKSSYLTNCKSFYSCIYCRTHLADHDELVSRSFQGNHGRAYLFNSVVNVECGSAVARELNTGSHAVADIRCASCRTTLGWKYERAYVESQKYKEGKYIIELAHVVRENRHLELDRLLLPDHKSPASSHIGSPDSSLGGRRDLIGVGKRSRSCSSSTTATSSTSDSQSPSSELDDLDYIFSFLDDVAGGRSSCQADLTPDFHSRNRRSLYSESAPYDWKYAGSPPQTGDNMRFANGAGEGPVFDSSGAGSPQQPHLTDSVHADALADNSESGREQQLEASDWLSPDGEQFYDCYSDDPVAS